MKKVLLASLLVLPAISVAGPLDLLPKSEPTESAHKFFMSTYNSTQSQGESFDVWNIESGYAYNVFGDVDLYIATSMSNSQSNQNNGFLSGVSYQFNDRITVNSGLRAQVNKDIDANEQDKKLSAEVSSRVKLSDNIDLRATLDVEEWQQGIEVGLGFSF
ncbi:ribonuclease regulator [Vibrio sp. SCSIO 43136]|uniref:ribonuclease regulator n=1 Tax=Vibrio sp. SCSIO 43136 TaxID=2819101 RepID=UPI002075811F|nr:ribonuclease regulator [Vibrio sp. SCSIO 43136]USD65726.1 ribonuclease regulator [Vibrio sp. SCSIO 43136]